MTFYSPQNKRISSGSTPEFISPLSKTTTEYLYKHRNKHNKDVVSTPSSTSSDMIRDLSELIEHYQTKEFTVKLIHSPLNFSTPLFKLSNKDKTPKMLSPTANQFYNTPNQLQRSVASVDLMMITPNSCSKRMSSILVPLKLSFMTPVQSIKEDQIHYNPKHIINEKEESDNDLSCQILDIFKNFKGVSVPSWLKDVRVSLNIEQIKILLDSDTNLEDIQKELNYHVLGNRLEILDEGGTSYYRICT